MVPLRDHNFDNHPHVANLPSLLKVPRFRWPGPTAAGPRLSDRNAPSRPSSPQVASRDIVRGHGSVRSDVGFWARVIVEPVSVVVVRFAFM